MCVLQVYSSRGRQRHLRSVGNLLCKRMCADSHVLLKCPKRYSRSRGHILPRSSMAGGAELCVSMCHSEHLVESCKYLIDVECSFRQQLRGPAGTPPSQEFCACGIQEDDSIGTHLVDDFAPRLLAQGAGLRSHIERGHFSSTRRQRSPSDQRRRKTIMACVYKNKWHLNSLIWSTK